MRESKREQPSRTTLVKHLLQFMIYLWGVVNQFFLISQLHLVNWFQQRWYDNLTGTTRSNIRPDSQVNKLIFLFQFDRCFEVVEFHSKFYNLFNHLFILLNIVIKTKDSKVYLRDSFVRVIHLHNIIFQGNTQSRSFTVASQSWAVRST